jgi:hypothetical protein
MTVRLLNESQLTEYDGKLPDLPLVHFKIVHVAKTVLERHDHDSGKVCTEVAAQPGFFLIGENLEDVRDSMHQLVEQFYEAVKKKQDESKIEQEKEGE